MKKELESPKVLEYVSDVYKFLMFVVPCYVIGIYIPSHYQMFNSVSHHWFLIGSLVTLILTLEGMFNILLGSVSAVSFGVVLSNCLTLEPTIAFVVGCATFIMFGSVFVCSRFFHSRHLVVVYGSTLTMILTMLLLWLTGTYSRIHLLLYLISMTFYVYSNVKVVFNWAIHHVSTETSMKRETVVAIDAFSILFLGLFIRIN